MKRIVSTGIAVILFPVTAILFLAPILVYFLPLFNTGPVLMIVRISLVLWAVIGITSVFYLSAYCGYLCPVTKLFVLMAAVTGDRSILSHRFPQLVGTIVRVLWSAAPLYVWTRALGNWFHLLPQAGIYARWEVILFYSLYAAAVVIAGTRFGRDELGHYMCPIAPFLKTGIKLNAMSRLPGYRLLMYPERCGGCRSCNRVCSYQNDVRAMVAAGAADYRICSNCGKCLEACGRGAIERKWVS